MQQASAQLMRCTTSYNAQKLGRINNGNAQIATTTPARPVFRKTLCHAVQKQVMTMPSVYEVVGSHDYSDDESLVAEPGFAKSGKAGLVWRSHNKQPRGFGTFDAPAADADPLAPLAAEMTALGYRQVLSRAGILSGAGGALAPDHLFTNLLINGMTTDNEVFTRILPDGVTIGLPKSTEVVVAFKLGTQVCGHPGIVHGGLTTAMIDETLGYLMYLVRRDGHVTFDQVLTARLETDFRKPILAASNVVVTARVTSIEGRKIWATVVAADTPLTDEQFASATAPPARKSDKSAEKSDKAPAQPSPAAAVARGLFVAVRPVPVPGRASAEPNAAATSTANGNGATANGDNATANGNGAAGRGTAGAGSSTRQASVDWNEGTPSDVCMTCENANWEAWQ